MNWERLISGSGQSPCYYWCSPSQAWPCRTCPSTKAAPPGKVRMFDRRAKIGFTLFLLAVTALQFYLTLGLGRIARLVPLWVVVPTLGLLLLQLIADIAPPRLKWRHHPRTPWLLMARRLTEIGDTGINNAVAGPQSNDAYLAGRNFIWISWMVISIYLLGLLCAVPLYALLYLKTRAGQGWRSSIAVASSMGFILYALIVHVLGKTLNEGQLWSWIGWS